MKFQSAVFLLFVLTISGTFAQVNLSQGVIANYPFDGNANDVSGNNLNGNVFGNVTLTTDRFGNPNSAYDFGGTNTDYIEVPHSSLLNFSGRSFSISVWAYRTRLTFNGMLVYKGGDIVDGYGIRVNADGFGMNARFRLGDPIRWQQFGADDIASYQDIVDSVWTNYVGTYDDATKTMRFYEDGELVSEKVLISNFVQNNNFPLTIGQHSALNKTPTSSALYPFQGKIDDVKIYDRILTGCEAYAIANDINTCLGLNDGLVGKYGFCASPNDESIRGNNGTVLGAMLSPDRYGKEFSAYDFDGVSSRISLGNKSDFNFLTNDTISLSAWVKFNSTTNPQAILSHGNGAYGLNIVENTGSSYAEWAKPLTTITGNYKAKLNTGVWQHVVVTNSIGHGVKTYVNGRLRSDIPFPYSYAYSKELFIGYSDTDGKYFQGSIDDIRIYKRKLTKGEVKAIYFLPSTPGICCPVISQPTGLQNYSICGTGSAVMSVTGGLLYKWYATSIGGIVLSNASTLPSGTISQTTTYYVSNTISQCESARLPITVHVLSLPGIPLINNQSACVLGNFTFTGTTTGLLKWYSTTVSGGFIKDGNPLITGNITSTGNYFATNFQGGCESPFVGFNAIINAKPDTVPVLGAYSVCPNVTNVNYWISSVPGFGYEWSVKGGTISGINTKDSVKINWGLSHPSAYANVRVKNLVTGCYSDSARRRVVINQLLTTQTPDGDTVSCLFQSRNLRYAISPTNGSKYSWTVLNGKLESNPDVYYVNITATTPGIIKLTVLESVTTTSNICKDQSDTLYVKVLPSPDSTKSIIGPGEVCQLPQSYTYTLNGFTGSSYSWSSTGGNFATPANASVVGIIYSSPGSHTVSGIEITNNGCLGKPIRLVVRADPPFRTNIRTTITTVCGSNANNLKFTADGFVNSSYTWFFDNANWSFTGQGNSTISGNLSLPGVSKIYVTETPLFPNTCPNNRDTISMTIISSPDPTLVINGESLICQKTFDKQYVLNGARNSLYNWSITGLANSLTNGDSLTNINANTSGNHILSVVETFSNGCPGTTITKNIFIAPASTITGISGVDRICLSTNDLVYSVAGFVGSSYGWTISGLSNKIVSGDGTSEIKILIDTTFGSSTINLSASELTSEGCVSAPIIKSISYEAPKPILGYVTNNDFGNELSITYKVLGGFSSASLLKNQSTLIRLTANTGTYTDNDVLPDSLKYQYQLISTDQCGTLHFSSIHRSILLKGRIKADSGSIKLHWSPYTGWKNGIKVYEIYGRQEGGAFALLASTIDTLANIVVWQNGKNQEFKVKAISIDSDTLYSFSNIVTGKFEKDIIVFTGFTPNNDQINDNWIIDKISLYKQNSVKVLDKWGNVVFSSSPYKNDWDGTAQGEKLPAGTYYYVIDLGTGEKPSTGSLVIIH